MDYYFRIAIDQVLINPIKYLSLYSSGIGGFGMTLSHRRAAVFTARRYELFEVVSSTLTYLHPDSRVHSFLSPLPYQVLLFSFKCWFLLSIMLMIGRWGYQYDVS